MPIMQKGFIIYTIISNDQGEISIIIKDKILYGVINFQKISCSN